MVLWGITAILGKLITLAGAAAGVVAHVVSHGGARAVSAGVAGAARHPAERWRWPTPASGCLVALHWLAFYGSVKLANASVAATTMALAPVVTALIEPWLTGVALRKT